MTSPVLALRQAILAAVQGDAALAALMGGSVRLHDEPPRAAEPVYAVFGDVTAEDASTSSERGHEQDIALTVWSREGSARSGIEVAERLAVLLDDAPLALAGHHLVNLRLRSLSAGRDPDTGLARVTLRLRAVTEVA
ncbi:MAG TPA: DUF3168 domain-containing protein [Microvirga sp.]|jgi:hypothetical protein|nr:DUF3168 domain-containing protein [Microvirga sp.]